MSPMFEQRHLAEEVAFLQKRMLPWADLDDRLAAGNDEHRQRRSRALWARRA
jgi:hypothetical protein